jgi:hypothetical protein
MGGLSGATHVALDIVRVMRLWFQQNRKDAKFAADALNFHFYCNDDQVTKGASPEECMFEQVATNLTAWRDANEPSLEVWLTEFGQSVRHCVSWGLSSCKLGFDLHLAHLYYCK